jgi:choline dehydrogenase-like flavoprotein
LPEHATRAFYIRRRVADASIIPTMVSGNTNPATIMTGERVADLVRETLRLAA